MRRLLPALFLSGVCAVQPALADRQCASAADQAAFEVQALRSHLVVLATGCDDGTPYNAFIRKYQSALVANDQAVTAWFKRRYGGRGQYEHDRFVTDLTNAVSSDATTLGSDFCPRDGMIFTEVMALRGSADLAPYAAAKDLIPPSIGVCTGQQFASAKHATKPSKIRR